MEQSTQQKVSSLQETLPISIHSSWAPYLLPIFQSNEMKLLRYEILKPNTFFPAKEDIFRVFSMPMSSIRVIILGSDPYIDGRANGLAFAVNANSKKPFSLRIIEQEVGHPIDRTLISWMKQGVFMLNTALTVEKDKPNSHVKYWKKFTEKVIEVITQDVAPVWMLWGTNAKAYEKLIRDIESFQYNHILKAAHPASETPNRNGGFKGCNHFNLCNEYFDKFNEQLINW